MTVRRPFTEFELDVLTLLNSDNSSPEIWQCLLSYYHRSWSELIKVVSLQANMEEVEL